MIRLPRLFPPRMGHRLPIILMCSHRLSTSTIGDLHGVFAVDKPAGMTSNDALNALKRALNPRVPRDLHSSPHSAADRFSNKPAKIKMGHGGTLDPFATGVLVVAVGHGTKALASYLACTKEYVVTGEFGSATDTYDLEGTQTHTAPYAHLTHAASLDPHLPAFRGAIMQRPPLFSALKRNGERLYDLARRAATPEALAAIPLPDPRPCTIHALELVHWDTRQGGREPPRVTLRVQCSKGTYIRSLVHDLGTAAGSAAHVVALRRTRQGEWGEDRALRRDRGEWTLDHVRRTIKLTDALGKFV